MGKKRVLSAAQEACIRQMICEKRPDGKMEFALWSRPTARMRHPIAYALGGQISRVLGFHTLQKPIRRAYEQSPAAVKVWLNTEYPAIAKRAGTGGSEIIGRG